LVRIASMWPNLIKTCAVKNSVLRFHTASVGSGL